jgi:hypothetical protein
MVCNNNTDFKKKILTEMSDFFLFLLLKALLALIKISIRGVNEELLQLFICLKTTFVMLQEVY